ncbi:MAG TPA: hypothetical protein VN445_11245 [Rectinemataceae bacterium]|nr:hypothetical protein [Rectinemataceae bacterium]
MNRYTLSIVMAFGLALFAFALPGQGTRPVSQEMIPLSSSIYMDMDALYLATGNGTPSNARPWSKTEANLILSRLDRASLKRSGLALYDSIAAAIAPGLKFAFRDGFGFGASLTASFEAYAHSNTDYDLESDWIYGFERRAPMAKLSLDFSVKDFFYAYCDMQYGRNRFNIADDLFVATTRYGAGIGAIIDPTDSSAILGAHSSIFSQPFLTNILEHSIDFDFQWPKRAVSAIGGANWNISLSRDKLSWGNGHSGNFVVDDHVDYQEFARLVAFTDAFKYDFLNIFLDTNTSPGENPDTEFKLLMAHRLEFRILKGLTFAISENVMYQNTVFDFRYLNPAFIYHNLNNSGMFNAIAHAELDYSFVKGFNLYAQFVMDQAMAPNEGTAQADAKGYMGGIEYASLIGPGILTTSLEFVSTDPLLYRREKVDFLMFRKYFTNGNPGGPGYVLSLDYIGYQYGGDAQVLQWDAAYRLPDKGTMGLRLFGMRHGEMSFFKSHNSGGNNAGYADYAGTTPSGDLIAETVAASIMGEFRAPRLLSWAEAKLWAELDWIHRRTWTKSTDSRSAWSADLQLSAGCSLSL